MRKTILTLAAVFQSTCVFATYYHLELGAGNYGQEGHTRKALATTYGANNVLIEDKEAFFLGVTDDASKAVLPLKPQVQYRILFRTLDELVRRNPDQHIVFHVNDLVPEWSDYAAEKLAEYAQSKQYTATVLSLPGNYFTLSPHIRYDTIHLKNPEGMYLDTMNGDRVTVTDQSRQRMREGLQKVANMGKHGLHFFILNADFYFPGQERIQYSMRGEFYHNTTEWTGLGYDLPDGLWSAPDRASHVFFIEASRTKI